MGNHHHVVTLAPSSPHPLSSIAFVLHGLTQDQTIVGGAIVVGAVILIALGLLVAALVKVLRTQRMLHEASAEGRRVSAQQVGANPTTSFARDGAPSDPLNVKFVSTSGQLAAAFTAAGWYRADEIDFVTSVRISYDSILNRKYSTAPVSNLYLYGRKEDYAFERPGKSVRQRDHVRLWNTGEVSGDGRPIWVGGATRDIAVEISPITHLPTHRIGSDVDAERESLMDSVIESGWVIADAWEAGFGQPTERRNSLGDSYHTDGRRAVLTLAQLTVLAPVVKQVRGRLASRIAKAAFSLVRWRLPQEGRDRAARRRELRLAREKAPVSAQ